MRFQVASFVVVSSFAMIGCGAETAAEQDEEIGEAQQALCSGYGCDGLDPIATGCVNGAFDVNPAPVCGDGICVSLRYSPTCGTNWSKVWTSNFLPDDIEGWVKAKDGRRECFPAGCGVFNTINSDSLYTDMIYCPDGTCLARACGARYGRYAPAICTSWY